MNKVFLNIFGIDVYWYSVFIMIAMAIGVVMATRQAEKTNLGKSFILDLAFYLIPVGIIGARIYYVIFNFSLFKDDIMSVFYLWEGGLAIYGGVLLGMLFAFYYCKKNKKSFLLTLDVFTPYLILGQAIGRWGNFINQEAYGPATTLEFLRSLHLPGFIINGMYINEIYYQPTFLYESLWCIIGFIVLLIIRKIIKYRKKGILVFSYFIWYGLGRFFIEGLRQDSLYLGNFRISQIVSIILMLIGVVGIIITLTRKDKRLIK